MPLLLWIERGGEITVSFDWDHEHFHEIEDALRLVAALLTEDLAVVSYWHDDEWRGSVTVEARELKAGRTAFHGFSLGTTLTQMRVRSWKGKHDVDARAGSQRKFRRSY